MSFESPPIQPLTFPTDYRLREDVFFPLSDQSESPFRYSDGEEFEEKIRQIIADADDRSLFSVPLRKAIWDWRSACHLSPVRANIMRPLEGMARGRRVLELGSGCGPITRYLGEVGAEVVALEASGHRAGVTRLRTQDLANVQVVCERIESFTAAQKFHMVTMIGVLQYARLFSNGGPEAERVLVRNAARQLTDDGVLVIAIQNKLGLKYFSGHPEPNVAIRYYGIENRYGPDSIIRFGQDELKALLASEGLAHHLFLYPFPDYHMPTTVLHESAARPESALASATLMACSTAGSRIHPDWTQPSFSLERAWHAVHSSGATPYLANAFLVIASRNEAALEKLRSTQDRCWHYSASRFPAFSTQTVFQANSHDRNLNVRKSRLTQLPYPDVPVRQTLPTGPYIAGQLWWEGLVNIMNSPSWGLDQLSEWTRRWLCELTGSPTPEKLPLDAFMEADTLDRTPLNCVADASGTLHFFDQEWHVDEPLPMHYVLVRGLFGSLEAVTSCATPAAGIERNLLMLIKQIALHCGIRLEDHHFEYFIRREAMIQGWINEGRSTEVSPHWPLYVGQVELKVRNDRASTESNAPQVHPQESSEPAPEVILLQAAREDLARMRETTKSLESALATTRQETRAALEEIRRVRATLSWRLTSPLRRLRRLWDKEA